VWEKKTYQGIPICSCCCTVIKYALIPKIVPAPISMISSQKLSCMAGQWYLVRTRCTTTSVVVLSVDAILKSCGWIGVLDSSDLGPVGLAGQPVDWGLNFGFRRRRWRETPSLQSYCRAMSWVFGSEGCVGLVLSHQLCSRCRAKVPFTYSLSSQSPQIP
jgi:hypothetical protein